jgi:hypothetical protein
MFVFYIFCTGTTSSSAFIITIDDIKTQEPIKVHDFVAKWRKFVTKPDSYITICPPTLDFQHRGTYQNG